MTSAVAVGTFNKETSDVDDTEQDISWSGPDFTPNFIRIFTQGQTVIGTSITNGTSMSEGWSDGTNTYSIAIFDESGADPTNTGRRFSKTKLLSIIDDTGVVSAECEIVSFSNKNVKIKWTTSSAIAIKIHFQAIEAINVEVGTFDAQTSTGNQNISHGSFTGNALMTMGTQQLISNVDTEQADLEFFYGMATAAADEVVVSTISEDAAATTNNDRGVTTAACVRGFNIGGSDSFVADFTSFTSGQFSINWSNASPSLWVCGFVVFEFDNAKVATATNPGTNGDDDTITALGFTATGAIFNTVQSSSANTSDSVMGIGAADSESTPNNAFCGFYSDNANSLASIGISEEDALCMRMLLYTDVDRGSGKVISYSSGVIEFNWVDTSGTRQFSYLAFNAQASVVSRTKFQSRPITGPML